MRGRDAPATAPQRSSAYPPIVGVPFSPDASPAKRPGDARLPGRRAVWHMARLDLPWYAQTLRVSPMPWATSAGRRPRRWRRSHWALSEWPIAATLKRRGSCDDVAGLPLLVANHHGRRDSVDSTHLCSEAATPGCGRPRHPDPSPEHPRRKKAGSHARQPCGGGSNRARERYRGPATKPATAFGGRPGFQRSS